jgi:hypothetical protein
VAEPRPNDNDQRRDTRALARFELFLFAAVATVLVVRTLLAVTGYPQVGGNGLHVAHVLWGGLLMGVAIVIVQILPGTRVRVRAALIGGIGFGLFIDEVGKFLTKDVDYFFKPAIAIIYAIFIAFYLAVRLVLERRPLNDRRRLALAAIALSDLALGQLDVDSRNYAVGLLAGVDETSALRETAEAVRAGLLAEPPDRRSPEVWLTHLRDRLATVARRWFDDIGELTVVRVIIAIEAVVVTGGAVLLIVHPAPATVGRSLLDVGLPSAISLVVLVIAALRSLDGRHRDAAEIAQWGVLIELLFTQVVIFNRQQFAGLIGFGINLVVIVALRFVQPPPPGESPTEPGTDSGAKAQAPEGAV